MLVQSNESYMRWAMGDGSWELGAVVEERVTKRRRCDAVTHGEVALGSRSA